jgi:gas vesicle protein
LATKAAKASSKSSKPKSQAKSAPAPSRAEQARAAAESAVDLPVGAVLEVSDRVVELVEPFAGRAAARKQLKSYGTQLRRTVKRSERRGAGARRKAATEARRTRSKVEREARKRQRTVETRLKRNRSEVEQRVRRVADQLAAIR